MPAEQATLAGNKIHETLEKAMLTELGFVGAPEQAYALKPVCQTVAYILANIADCLPQTIQTSVVLWRAANSILSRYLLQLSMTPADAEQLGINAANDDSDSPDELLFWLMERVEKQNPKTQNVSSDASGGL